MNDERPVERIVASLLAESATAHAPEELLLDTLTHVGRTRQRPRWLAFMKETPMRTPAGVAVGSPTFRLLSIALLTLVLTLAATAAVAVGASLILRQTPELPPPFGPAVNGVIAYDKDGDIWIADPTGEDPRAIITDAADDTYPLFSPDGTRLLFTRTVSGEPPHVMVANADGSGVVRIADVPGPIEGWTWTDWSPDSRSVVVQWTVDGSQTVSILSADGSEPARDLVLDGLIPAERPTWLPPDGGELVLTADTTSRSPLRGLYAVHPDGSGLRLLSQWNDPGCPSCPFQQASFSADGTRMAYWNWEANEAGLTNSYLHLLDLVTLEDRTLILDPLQEGVGFAPRIAPDGQSLLFEVAGEVEGDAQLVLAPLDGHEPARPVGPAYPNDLVGADFSPDGTTVLLDRGAGGTWMIDLATGDTKELGDAVTYASWQRRAD